MLKKYSSLFCVFTFRKILMRLSLVAFPILSSISVVQAAGKFYCNQVVSSEPDIVESYDGYKKYEAVESKLERKIKGKMNYEKPMGALGLLARFESAETDIAIKNRLERAFAYQVIAKTFVETYRFFKMLGANKRSRKYYSNGIYLSEQLLIKLSSIYSFKFDEKVSLLNDPSYLLVVAKKFTDKSIANLNSSKILPHNQYFINAGATLAKIYSLQGKYDDALNTAQYYSSTYDGYYDKNLNFLILRAYKNKSEYDEGLLFAIDLSKSLIKVYSEPEPESESDYIAKYLIDVLLEKRQFQYSLKKDEGARKTMNLINGLKNKIRGME